MRCVGQAMELDLHHAILPPLGRLKPDTDALFAAAVPVAATRFAVLCPADQVLHAAAHLFQDSDCIDRLRDLVDFDALFRRLPLTDRAARSALVERARLHGMEQPLHLAAQLSRAWFGTPGCDALVTEVGAAASALYGRGIVAMANRVLGPSNSQDGSDRSRRTAARLLEARSHWLRMPPWLLAYHTASKGVRRLAQWTAKREGAATG
jgi:hypothetical protein